MRKKKKARSQEQARNQRCDRKVLDGLRIQWGKNHNDRNGSNGLVWKWVQAGTRFLSLRVILYVFIFCESSQNRLTFTNTQTLENSKTGRVYEHKHLCTEGSWLPDPSPTALCLCFWLFLSHTSNGEWTFGTTQSLQLTHKAAIIPGTFTNSHAVEIPWPSSPCYLSCEPF